ncbi:MAG: thioredoxin domain-containing protein [Terracidiphilus sp.]|jgi:protein-disulfide isomerase
MPNVFASFSRKQFPRLGFALGLFSAVLLAASAAGASAQFGAPETTKVNDPAALKPPPGSHVAIVAFEDLECPDCARANPLLIEAQAKYKIPWVRHDFPLPFHTWSFQAAVNARFFDTKSKHMGDDYRNFIFANQPQIETLGDLVKFTKQFADEHKVDLPFAVDPMGRLAALVKADYALGQRVGIEHTPTIWVVTDSSHAAPFVEVVDRTKLYQLIDSALAATKH